MPFIAHTPESVLPRSDSRNPATTCKGLTSTGRPCRRALSASPRSSLTPSPIRGVLAVLTEEQPDGGRAAAFFCWQHQDQADQLGPRNQNETKIVPLRERTSIDTFVDRLGVLDLDESNPALTPKHKMRRKKIGSESTPTRRDTLPHQWNDLEGPLMSVLEELLPTKAKRDHHDGKVSHAKSDVAPTLFCCFRPADGDDLPPPRRRQVHQERRPSLSVMHGMSQVTKHGSGPTSQGPPVRRKPTPQTLPQRPFPTPITSSSSQTTSLLSFIPTHLSPQTTSALLAELVKPISGADESGYIYIFWLTPASANTPSADDASSLLAAPSLSSPRQAQNRRASDVLRSNSTARNGKSTVLLKIGRASNVHRRLTQWTRQCSFNLTLIRYYPYLPKSPSPSPVPSPRSYRGSLPKESSSNPLAVGPYKVPHVHRVERLIHIELAEKRVKDAGKCSECGKEHREWFEIEASSAGIREVDGCVKRWVAWAERQNVRGEVESSSESLVGCRAEPEGYF